MCDDRGELIYSEIDILRFVYHILIFLTFFFFVMTFFSSMDYHHYIHISFSKVVSIILIAYLPSIIFYLYVEVKRKVSRRLVGLSIIMIGYSMVVFFASIFIKINIHTFLNNEQSLEMLFITSIGFALIPALGFIISGLITIFKYNDGIRLYENGIEVPSIYVNAAEKKSNIFISFKKMKNYYYMYTQHPLKDKKEYWIFGIVFILKTGEEVRLYFHSAFNSFKKKNLRLIGRTSKNLDSKFGRKLLDTPPIKPGDWDEINKYFNSKLFKFNNGPFEFFYVYKGLIYLFIIFFISFIIFNAVPFIQTFLTLVFIIYIFLIYFYIRDVPETIKKVTEGEGKFIIMTSYKKKYEDELLKEVPEIQLDETPMKYFGIKY